jgi:hypothetical protein
MRVSWWLISFLFDQKIKKFLHFLGVVADAKWSEITTDRVACLLRVFLLHMILVAIMGLGDNNRSNKLAISKYMQGKYGELTPRKRRCWPCT